MNLGKIAMLLGYVWAVLWLVFGIIAFIIIGSSNGFIVITSIMAAVLIAGFTFMAGKWGMTGGVLLIIFSVIPLLGIFTAGPVILIGYVIFGAPVLTSGILFVIDAKKGE